MPSLPCFQSFGHVRKNPRGVAHHDVLVELVVHHDLSDTEIKQKCRLLKEHIVCVSVRRVVKLVNADNRRTVIPINSLQKTRITSMRGPVLLNVTDKFCALGDPTPSAEVSRVRGEG